MRTNHTLLEIERLSELQYIVDDLHCLMEYIDRRLDQAEVRRAAVSERVFNFMVRDLSSPEEMITEEKL